VVRATSDYPLLATYAVKRTNGTLALLVINKSASANLTANFNLSGYVPYGNSAIYSYGIPQDEAARTGVGSPEIAQTNFIGAATSFSATFAPFSATVMVMGPANQPPLTPTSLVATASNAVVSLSWNGSAGADSYIVKRSTTSGSGYATVGSSTTTSHVDPGLTNGTTYFYVTTSVNTCGPVSTESGNSSEVSATPSAGGCTPQTPNCEFQMSGGVASVEGEHWFVNSTTGVTTGDSWSQAAAAPASGGQCMVVGPDNGNSWTTNVTTTSPRLDFKVNFTAGTFFLHIRGDGSDGANDSCWGGRDGTLLTTIYDFPEVVNSWAWRSVSLGSVTAGIHTINVWGREDGFRLDKIVINTSSTAPTGAGPAESALN
jgi:hypothetical protein